MVVVSGEVGAGKTTLIRGACRALGVEGPSPRRRSRLATATRAGGCRSPTSISTGSRSLEGEDPALLDDYLAADAIAFIEWPAAAEPQLAERRIVAVRLAHAGGDRREIELPAASTRK